MLKNHLALSSNNASLLARIDTFDVCQISRPKTDGARKKSITEPVKASQENRRYCVNVKNKEDNWQAILDDVGNQIVFMLYYKPQIL